MVAVVAAMTEEQARRRDNGDEDWRTPFRPDRGHELPGDHLRHTHPGYPLIGRLRGLAELRGVMTAVASLRGLPL
jgi:mannonate dehydratase